MKGKKRSNFFLIPVAILIIVVSITLYLLFNPIGSKGDVKLNFFEQQWIQNNKNTVINVSIPNNVPLYSDEGNGLAFSFLDYFSNQTQLEFNKVPYILGDGTITKDYEFRVLNSDEKLKNNDLLFYIDNYVVLSKNDQKRAFIDNINGSIGVLDTDFNAVSSYLAGDKLTITRTSNIESLLSLFDNNQVTYIILPRNMYLNTILSKDYNIVNTLNDLSLKYVLTLKNDNSRLNDIIKKYYKAWTANYLTEDYNKELFNLYTSVKNIDDKSKTDFKSKRYVYGYVDSLPYEVNMDGELGGISNEFINAFSSFAGIEFNFKQYKSVTDLNNALTSGKVDVALNYYNLDEANTIKTIDLIYSNYVILTRNKTLVVDTIKALPGVNIYTLSNTNLDNYIKKNSRFKVNDVSKVSSLEGNDLILIDYNTYLYYRDNYFKDYTIAYQNIASKNYGYLVNKTSSNELFYNIFDYYLSTLNTEQYKNIGMDKVIHKTINFDFSLLWLYAILIPVFIVIVIAILRKRKKIVKVRTDIKLKYIDPLTSLKNRYYLNNNIDKWEENSIYPQSIVVININNLKDINDAYGHEGGDQLIKTAANILINNQMEKTDIMRTDGNEFIIYMVGYDESSVIAYIRKLYRLLKDLPYEYGASLGYSMIEDDIKTIEDAINEAILDMVTNRESKKNNEA